MRSIPLRPGETFITGDTAVSAEQGVAPEGPISNPTFHRPANPIQHQSTQQWLAAYEREERRLASGGCGDA